MTKYWKSVTKIHWYDIKMKYFIVFRSCHFYTAWAPFC